MNGRYPSDYGAVSCHECNSLPAAAVSLFIPQGGLCCEIFAARLPWCNFLSMGMIIALRGHARVAPRGLAHLACPNVFPSPIVSSFFSRLYGISVRIRATDDDDSPAAALSIHSEFSRNPCNSTARY